MRRSRRSRRLVAPLPASVLMKTRAARQTPKKTAQAKKERAEKERAKARKAAQLDSAVKGPGEARAFRRVKKERAKKERAKTAKKTAKKAPWPKLAQIIFESKIQSCHRKKSNGVFVCYIHNKKRRGLLVRVMELVELVRVTPRRSKLSSSARMER